MVMHQRVQLTDQCSVLTQRKISVDPILERRQALLLEPRDLALRERLIHEVRQRRPAPKREGAPKPVTRYSRISRSQRAATLSDQCIEPIEVNLAARGLEQIPATARDQQSIAERFAQMRHVALNDLLGARRRLLTPQLVDQTIRRDRLAATQHEHHQQRFLLGTAERQRPLVLDNLKRPQDSGFDHDLARPERYHRAHAPKRPRKTGLYRLSTAIDRLLTG